MFIIFVSSNEAKLKIFKMKTLLKTQKSTVISILGIKLWIVKADQSNWHFSLSRQTVGFFNYGVQFNQKNINVGLKNNFID